MLPLLTLLLAASPSTQLGIRSERLMQDGQRHLTTYEGHVRVRSDELALDADRLVYDETQQAITAAGQVVARFTRGGLVAMTAEVLTLKLDGDEVRDVYLLNGRAVSKKGTSSADLLAADTEELLNRTGTAQVLLEGNHLHHEGTTWTAEHLTLVPCDCDLTKPSWSIESGAAVVDTEAQRVFVTSPVVRVRHVPVLWLPWLSLPLSSRQSGLLFPHPLGSTLNGFGLELPVFITLGRSADLTLTPGFYTGGNGPFGIAGPRLGVELRYVPSTRATGRVSLGVLYDTRAARDPFDATSPPLVTSPAAPRGLRGELSWAHLQDFDGGFGARVDLNAYSDGFYNRDITTDVIAATSGYLRSTATVFQRSDWHLLSLESTLRQDLLLGFDWFGRAAQRTTFGPGQLQRFPSLAVSVPLKQVAGPLFVDAVAEFVRLAPLFSNTGDEGVSANEGSTIDENGEVPWLCLSQRLFGNPGPRAICGLEKSSQGDRLWAPGEREARDRLMVLPRLRLAGSVAGVVALSAFAAWRQSAWWGEASGRSWQRGTLIVDARAETELSRTFGAYRHVLQPLVAVRALPLSIRGSSDASSLEPVPYDEVDAAVPRGGGARVQAVAELRQRLVRAGGQEVLRLDLGQGFDLLAPERAAPSVGEGWARVAATVGPVRLAAAAQLDPVLVRLTRLGASCGVDDGRGHGVVGSYEQALEEGNARTRAPIDLLFGPPVPQAFFNRTQLLTAAAFWNFGPVALRYDILFGTAALAPLALAQHVLSVSLTPACNCWRLDISAREGAQFGVPDLSASLTISGFGSIGTR